LFLAVDREIYPFFPVVREASRRFHDRSIPQKRKKATESAAFALL
jgi:hypothetical protein